MVFLQKQYRSLKTSMMVSPAKLYTVANYLRSSMSQLGSSKDVFFHYYFFFSTRQGHKISLCRFRERNPVDLNTKVGGPIICWQYSHTISQTARHARKDHSFERDRKKSGAQNKPPKTQILKVNNKQDDYIKLDARNMDQVDGFVYLGSVVGVWGSWWGYQA